MTINRDYLQIKRICKRKYLNFMYAPKGYNKKYYVYSEVYGIDKYMSDFGSGSLGIIKLQGHVVRVNGKPKKVWIS
jgi:hypothetical protein